MLNRWVVAGAVAAAGSLAAWGIWSRAQRRRAQLRRGEIRLLNEMWITLGGCRVFARCCTAGGKASRLPIVLVHGFGVSSSYFVPTAERLAAEFNVYAPDLPGHGCSDTPPEPLDVPRLSEALVAWLDAVGLERVILVGNSMGCQTAVETAVRYPERVERLVLIGPTVDPQARSVPRQFLRLICVGPFESPPLLWILFVDYTRMGTRLFAELRFMLDDAIEEKLPCVEAPTLLVRGRHDWIAPLRWLVEAAALLPSSRIALLEQGGHAVNHGVPRELVSRVLPFLREAVCQDTLRWSAGCDSPT